MGIFISQYKDPYKPTSIMESNKGFFRSSIVIRGSGGKIWKIFLLFWVFWLRSSMSSVLQSAMSEYSMPPHLQISLSNLFFILILVGYCWSCASWFQKRFLPIMTWYIPSVSLIFVHEQVANHHHYPPCLSVGWIMLKYHIPWRFKQWRVLHL